MSPLLHAAMLAFGLLVIVSLELRSRPFRRISTGRGNRKRVRRNFAFLVGALVSGVVASQLLGLLTGFVTPVVVLGQHPVINAVLCILTADLIGWVLHWVKHKSGFLWRFHFQHHRDVNFDLWLVTHTHALEVIFSSTLMGLLLALLGCSALSLQIYVLFYTLANTYQHSSFDYSLGILDKIIVSPAYHRLHHAVGNDTNFGDSLTIWDCLFRTVTWPKPEAFRTLRVGLSGSGEPYGFFAEMSYPLSRRASKGS